MMIRGLNADQMFSFFKSGAKYKIHSIRSSGKGLIWHIEEITEATIELIPQDIKNARGMCPKKFKWDKLPELERQKYITWATTHEGLPGMKYCIALPKQFGVQYNHTEGYRHFATYEEALEHCRTDDISWWKRSVMTYKIWNRQNGKLLYTIIARKQRMKEPETDKKEPKLKLQVYSGGKDGEGDWLMGLPKGSVFTCLPTKDPSDYMLAQFHVMNKWGRSSVYLMSNFPMHQQGEFLVHSTKFSQLHTLVDILQEGEGDVIRGESEERNGTSLDDQA